MEAATHFRHATQGALGALPTTIALGAMVEARKKFLSGIIRCGHDCPGVVLKRHGREM
jgi:hypothetical protein